MERPAFGLVALDIPRAIGYYRSMKIDASHLSPMLLGRVNKALDKTYNFGGRICSMRDWIADLATISKSESSGMCDFNRKHYNNLPGTDE